MSLRVAGIDPGTVSFDVCGLDDGAVFCDVSVRSSDLAANPAALIEVLGRYGPLDLVVGPSGFGLPLVRADQVGPPELSQMLLVRADERRRDVGIGGMRRLIQALLETGIPLVFAPGVIHLTTVPDHRKWNRIDMGTADKVCSAALCIHDQARRLGLGYGDCSFLMLELGGAFSAALAVERGRIVDGLGGSSGPMGLQAAGGLDAEAAYLLAPTFSKDTVFSGGALAGADPAPESLAALITGSHHREAWLALTESAVKAVLALTAAVPDPREVLLTGRLAALPQVAEELGARLARVAPVRTVSGLGARAKAASQGAALLADGLAGGRFKDLVETMELRGARGTALDHLRLLGAGAIRLA